MKIWATRDFTLCFPSLKMIFFFPHPKVTRSISYTSLRRYSVMNFLEKKKIFTVLHSRRQLSSLQLFRPNNFYGSTTDLETLETDFFPARRLKLSPSFILYRECLSGDYLCTLDRETLNDYFFLVGKKKTTYNRYQKSGATFKADRVCKHR